MALVGAEIRFDKDKCLILKNSKEFVIRHLLSDKLYTVNTIEYAQVSKTDSARSLEVWHCRLGHLNYTYVNQLVKKEMVDGLNCEHRQPDHMGLYTVMYVAHASGIKRVVVNTCLHSQMIIHGTRLFTSSNPRVKFFRSSRNMSILLRNILVTRL